MKKLLILLLSALSLTVFAQQKKVAVYVTGDDPINSIMGDHLVDGIAHDGKYIAVERTASFLNELSKPLPEGCLTVGNRCTHFRKYLGNIWEMSEIFGKFR